MHPLAPPPPPPPAYGPDTVRHRVFYPTECVELAATLELESLNHVSRVQVIFDN